MNRILHPTANQQLISHLKRTGWIIHESVEQAMLQVDRGWFVPPKPHGHINENKEDGKIRKDDDSARAYADRPQAIGYGATISAPHIHAIALETFHDLIRPGREVRVLDIGSGSGYLTACLAWMLTHTSLASDPDQSPDLSAKAKGSKVIGVESISELVEQCHRTFQQHDLLRTLMEDHQVEFHVLDGRRGYAPAAPYDAIHVGAADQTSDPSPWLEQLKVPGRLVVPMEMKRGGQSLMCFEKQRDGAVLKRVLLPSVLYVPLV